NLNHLYTLLDSDKAFLQSLGLDSDALLAAMNAIRIAPDLSSRHYVEHYADFTGSLPRPVLTVHGVADDVAIVHHESAYFATVQAAGATPLLAQTFTNGVGHGNFTAGQVLFAVRAMQ